MGVCRRLTKMTHMWKSQEVYTFDMPEQRIGDVYVKNARFKLWPYLRAHNPKITKLRFDEQFPGLHIEVDVPKYPESYPYFTKDDSKMLLESYMDYANMTLEEIQAWYKTHMKVIEQ